VKGLAAVLSVVALAAAAASSGSVNAPSATACYSAQFTAFVPRVVTLSDAIATSTVRLDYPDTVCTSAPGSAPDYLACFAAKSVRTRAAQAGSIRAVAGLWTAVAFRPVASSVCYAGTQEDSGHVSKPSPGVGPYVCYAAGRGTATASAGDGVTVKDDFGSSTDKLVRASRVCASATSGASSYLACYTVDSDTVGSTVVVRTDFGLTRAAPGPRDELCAPARVR
jgi:hypothetical protein